MIRWIKKLFGLEENPDLQDLDEDIEQLYLKLEELEAKLASFQLEIWDYIKGTLEPLNRRVATRLQRQRQSENINSDKPLKKGGLITPQEMNQRKQYGIT